LLKIMTAASTLPLTGSQASGRGPKPSSGRAPVLFLAHGAPPLLDDAGWVAELGAWAKALPRPTSVLMLSAHWDERPLAIGATRTVPLVYDFSGFPERFYRLTYPSPGAPDLALRVRSLLASKQIAFQESPDRGLDHGAWVPLMCMYPKADVPVLQISLPGLEPKAVFALGETLAPLREEGVLIVGSGFLTHNLRAGFLEETPSWASEFDEWAKRALVRGDADALMDFRKRAPGMPMALPTTEHYVPVLGAAGAAGSDRSAVTFPITGFWLGGFTRRSVQFG
jgi:4,5-DOPA dioxygenase extradiol